MVSPVWQPTIALAPSIAIPQSFSIEITAKIFSNYFRCCSLQVIPQDWENDSAPHYPTHNARKSLGCDPLLFVGWFICQDGVELCTQIKLYPNLHLPQQQYLISPPQQLRLSRLVMQQKCTTSKLVCKGYKCTVRSNPAYQLNQYSRGMSTGKLLVLNQTNWTFLPA